MSPGRRPTVVLVGATGAVGTVMRELVGSRDFDWGEVRLAASPRSAGRWVPVGDRELEVRAVAPEVFDGAAVALFDVPDEVSREWAPVAVGRGAVVVDKSAAFRLDPDVPLVVPEVNPQDAAHRPRGIVASPNCTALAMIVALAALHRAFELESLVACSYQAASGAGMAGVQTLRRQVSAVAADDSLGSRPGDLRAALDGDLGPFAAPLALNVVPWVGSTRPGGWSSEEVKLRAETRKILGLPELPVSATCVRVPVVTGHGVAVHARFARPVAVAAAREVLAAAAGVALRDDPAAGELPTPADAVGTDPTWIGRLRAGLDDPRELSFFACTDNLRKGAALNAAQVAELVAAELAGTPPSTAAAVTGG